MSKEKKNHIVKKVILINIVVGLVLGITLISYAELKSDWNVKYTTNLGEKIYEGYGDGYSTFDGTHITLNGELLQLPGGPYRTEWHTAVDDAGNPYTGWVRGDGFMESAYFLNGKVMDAGWHTIDGRLYYFKNNVEYGFGTPEAIPGWSNDKLKTLEWKKIDDKYYLFRSTGVWGIPAMESVTLDTYGGHKVIWNSDRSFKSIDGVYDVKINELSTELQTAIGKYGKDNLYSVMEQLDTDNLKFETQFSEGWSKGIQNVQFAKGIIINNDGTNGNCNITEFDFSIFPLLNKVTLWNPNLDKIDLSTNTEISQIGIAKINSKKEILLPNTGNEISIRTGYPSYDLEKKIYDSATGQVLSASGYNDFKTVAVGQTIIIA